MKAKNFISLLCIVFIAMGLLVGCGSDKGTEPEAKDTEDKDELVINLRRKPTCLHVG